jgi:putative aldouronate transport system substrate-binding protein
MKDRMKGIASAILFLVLASVVFVTGCKKEVVSQADDGGPFKISVMTRQSTGEIPRADHPILLEIGKIANVALDVQFVPNAAFDERLAVTVASNNYPMLTLFPSNSKPTTIEVDAVSSGVFWKVGDYIKNPNFKWLNELDDTRIANASVNGDLWGMFRFRPSVRDGFYYRTDWMEKLGLEAPKNREDLYNMLKAFVEQDPDGNGIADTGGTIQWRGINMLIGTLAPTFGLGNGWNIIDGKLVPTHLQPVYLDMLKYIKKLYDDGLMNRDFPTVEVATRDEMLGAGKWGLAIDSIDKGIFSIASLQKQFPGASLTPQVGFADYSAPVFGRSGFDGKFYVSKKAVPTEADMLKVMEYFNHMYSPAVNNLVYNGVEGTHYTKTGDNSISVNDEQRIKYAEDVQPIEQLAMRYEKNNFIVENEPAYDAQVNEFFYNYPGETASDPTWVLDSETYNTRGTELTLMIEDARVQYITGAIDDAGWAAVIARWKSQGGDKMVTEYQASYDAMN